MKIIVSPYGGNGSTALINMLQACQRPDFGFNEPSFIAPLSKIAKKHMAHGWKARTRGIELLVGETLEKNLLNLIEKSTDWIYLFGICSSVDKFLTRNNIKAYCLVRHPRASYCSLFERHSSFFPGKIDSLESVRHYGKQWNIITSDFLTSPGTIIHYERLPQEISDPAFKQFSPRPDHEGELPEETEEALKDTVKENFSQIWDSW